MTTPEVVFEIDRQHQADYIKAASFINAGPDIDSIIQHEYGIFEVQMVNILWTW